jgi:transcription termination factor Rho
MDDVIFEEFKGTGNMEVHLNRALSEKRIFPAIDINKSGTRKEEKLLDKKELETVFALRKAMSSMSTEDVTEQLITEMTRTKNNKEFIDKMDIFLKRFKD